MLWLRRMGPAGPGFTRGMVAYLAITFVLAWVPTWPLGGAWLGEVRPLGTRLLTCSPFYAGCMGWQPIAAVALVRRWLDPPGPSGWVILDDRQGRKPRVLH